MHKKCKQNRLRSPGHLCLREDRLRSHMLCLREENLSFNKVNDMFCTTSHIHPSERLSCCCLTPNELCGKCTGIYIDYYMSFFISYPLSVRGHDIKGWYMNEGWSRVWYEKWHVMFIIYFNGENNWFVPKCLVIFG